MPRRMWRLAFEGVAPAFDVKTRGTVRTPPRPPGTGQLLDFERGVLGETTQVKILPLRAAAATCRVDAADQLRPDRGSAGAEWSAGVQPTSTRDSEAEDRRGQFSPSRV